MNTTYNNKVQLIGSVGDTPQISISENDHKSANMILSTIETFRTTEGEKLRETVWHNIICHGKLADISEKYIVKGTEIALEGKIITRSTTDKQGKLRMVVEIHANELLILSKS